jgi:hypothetical protein
MTARVSCSSGPACPDAGRVRAVFARTDLRYSLFRVSRDAMLDKQGLTSVAARTAATGPELQGRTAGGTASPYVPMLLIGTDLRPCAWHRLQPVCLCLRRGGVYPARRRKTPSIRFADLRRFSLRQGTACLRRQARRRFAVAFVFVGAGLIPARRRKTPSIRFADLPRTSLRQGTASVHPEARRAVPKVQHLQGALAPEGRFMHRGIKMHPPASILHRGTLVFPKRKLHPNFPVSRNGTA